MTRPRARTCSRARSTCTTTRRCSADPTARRDRYDTKNPIYQHIARLSEVRAAPGARRRCPDQPLRRRRRRHLRGVSRIDAGAQTGRVRRRGEQRHQGGDGHVPDMDARATGGCSRRSSAPTRRQAEGRRLGHGHRPAAHRERVAGQQADLAPPARRPDRRDRARRRRRHHGRAEVTANVQRQHLRPDDLPVAPGRDPAWTTLGTDDNAPFRVFHDVSGLPGDTSSSTARSCKDAAGRVAADST